jgi:hypothetical protein
MKYQPNGNKWNGLQKIYAKDLQQITKKSRSL